MNAMAQIVPAIAPLRCPSHEVVSLAKNGNIFQISPPYRKVTGNQWYMLSQDTAEKKEEGQAVDDAAGSDVPSRFTYKKGECAAAYPDGKEYIGSNVPVKVEQTPRQKE